MRFRRCVPLLTLTLLIFCTPAFTQEKLLTNDDIFNPVKRVNFNGNASGNLQWLVGGEFYLQPKFDRKTKTGTILKVNARTGESAPFFDADK
ncbi:MAG: hypothetical protein QOH96_848, partial [Blastocatellia bacterium]|nr:hypothetical protein [Blastocatellia bacterium]